MSSRWVAPRCLADGRVPFRGSTTIHLITTHPCKKPCATVRDWRLWRVPGAWSLGADVLLARVAHPGRAAPNHARADEMSLSEEGRTRFVRRASTCQLSGAFSELAGPSAALPSERAMTCRTLRPLVKHTSIAQLPHSLVLGHPVALQL
jgi:hypothetical protein